jgi:hypothetical protein
MLHSPLDNLNVVYVGIYNWGEVECLQKVTAFMYGVFQKT